MKSLYKKYMFIALITILALFVGLRYKTGYDYSGYIRHFNKSVIIDLADTRIEPGFMIVNRVFKSVFDNYFVLQFFFACFFCFAAFKFITKYSKYQIVSLTFIVLLYFYAFLMAQIRQATAVGIVLLATKYIFSRKPVQFFCMVLLASMFHISAIVAVLLYFLYRNYGKVIPIVFMISAFVLGHKGTIIMLLLYIMSPFMPERMSKRILFFLENESDVQRPNEYYILLLILIAIFLVLKVKNNDKKTSFFLNALAVAMILRGMSIGVTLFNRVSIYFSMYAIITYTYLFSVINFNKLKDLFLIYVCAIMVFFGAPYVKHITETGHKAHFEPYYNVLEHPYKAQFRRDWNEE